MLVLSRRCQESIVLPEQNVTLTVLSVKPGVVRLGIEAPPEVPVYRQEIAPQPAPRPDQPSAGHQLRNRLNAVNLGLNLMRQQLQAGMVPALDKTLSCVEAEFQALRELMAAAPPPMLPAVRRALLVEDDRNERELLAGCLRMAGLDVVTAGDGADALDHLRGEPLPDVVLLDMVLPKCGGPETIRAIRHDPHLQGVRIFAVTGHSREHFELADSVDGWFEKPLDPSSLLRRLGIGPAGL